MVLVVVVGPSTEVDLNEVEAEFLEEEVGVLLVVAIEPHALADDIAIEHAAAGVAPGIGVDAGLEVLAVDVVHEPFQAVGEALGVDEELTRLCVAPSEVAVVDIDIGIATATQALRDHRIGLLANQGLADVDAVGVPGGPPHRGAVVGGGRLLSEGWEGKGEEEGELR